MTLADLLRETIDLPEQEVWENERTPTPVRVFGVRPHSMGLSLREVVAVLDLLEIALMELCGTGRMIPPKHNQTRRRWNRRGLLSMRDKLRSMAKQNDSTETSIRTQNVFSTSTCTAAAGLTPRRRSSLDLLKSMSSTTLNFSSTA